MREHVHPYGMPFAATKNPGRLLIECSTMEIESTQEVGKVIRHAGLGTFVDSDGLGWDVGC